MARLLGSGRGVPCLVCGAPPTDRTAAAREAGNRLVRLATEPGLQQLVLAMDTDGWRSVVGQLPLRKFCGSCAAALASAKHFDKEARGLAMLAAHLDPDNVEATALLGRLGGLDIDPDERLAGLAGLSRISSLEPDQTQRELDEVQEKADRATRRLTDTTPLDPAEYSSFKEKFARLQDSKYFSLAVRDGLCVGFWVAWVTRKGERWPALPISAATIEHMLKVVTQASWVRMAADCAAVVQRGEAAVMDVDGGLILLDGSHDASDISLVPFAPER